MTAPIRPRGCDDLVVIELDGEAVVYDEASGDLHHLNATATSVFGMCDGSASVREVSAELADVYGVSGEDVEAQVRRLIRQLKRAGLVTNEKPHRG